MTERSLVTTKDSAYHQLQVAERKTDPDILSHHVICSRAEPTQTSSETMHGCLGRQPRFAAKSNLDDRHRFRAVLKRQSVVSTEHPAEQLRAYHKR